MTTLSLQPSAWVRHPRPLPQAMLRLFCLPYGGGEASFFRNWPQARMAREARNSDSKIHAPK